MDLKKLIRSDEFVLIRHRSMRDVAFQPREIASVDGGALTIKGIWWNVAMASPAPIYKLDTIQISSDRVPQWYFYDMDCGKNTTRIVD